MHIARRFSLTDSRVLPRNSGNPASVLAVSPSHLFACSTRLTMRTSLLRTTFSNRRRPWSWWKSSCIRRMRTLRNVLLKAFPKKHCSADKVLQTLEDSRRLLTA